MTWLWRQTGHRVSHWLGWNPGTMERRVLPRAEGSMVVVGYRCSTCGRWEA